jgi:hypothetical protein
MINTQIYKIYNFSTPELKEDMPNLDTFPRQVFQKKEIKRVELYSFILDKDW